MFGPTKQRAASPASEPTPGPSRVDETTDARETTLDAQVVIRNATLDPTVLTVVRRRGGEMHADTIEAEPETTYGVGLPAGTGRTLVEIYTETVTATTSVAPGDRPPVVSCRDGAVLVDRE